MVETQLLKIPTVILMHILLALYIMDYFPATNHLEIGKTQLAVENKNFLNYVLTTFVDDEAKAFTSRTDRIANKTMFMAAENQRYYYFDYSRRCDVSRYHMCKFHFQKA